MGKTGKAVMFMIYTVVVLIVGGYAGVILHHGWERYQQASQAVAQNTAFVKQQQAMVKGLQRSAQGTEASAKKAAALWKIHQQCTARGGIETKSGCVS